MRREGRAVGEFADILGAVDDDELALLVEEAGIAGLQPAVGRQRVPRHLLLLVVAHEDVGALQHDLAAVVDLDLDARDRPADRVGIGLGIGLAGDQRRRLGGAVDLLQVDAEGAEEAVGVGSERRAAGVAPARLAEAELVAHRAVDQQLAQREARAIGERQALAVGPLPRTRGA